MSPNLSLVRGIKFNFYLYDMKEDDGNGSEVASLCGDRNRLEDTSDVSHVEFVLWSLKPVPKKLVVIRGGIRTLDQTGPIQRIFFKFGLDQGQDWPSPISTPGCDQIRGWRVHRLSNYDCGRVGMLLHELIAILE
ncbi:unnamed protein product [Cuscuta epithymum]|uniref:Uncharacterized protein n=1 Tax=Cuscuta epithymum TaxID=186058 RepID=A0AAV0G748_9ASTE|nr:unnamed protein product [Cuscuta epithymum]